MNANTPDAVYSVKHSSRTDDLLFYSGGLYRRRESPDHGRWNIDEKGMLLLEWEQWEPEETNWNGSHFANNNMVLYRHQDSPSLWDLLHRKPVPVASSPLMTSEEFETALTVSPEKAIDLRRNAWVITTPNRTGEQRVSQFYHQYIALNDPLPLTYTGFDSRKMIQTFNLDIKVKMYKKTVFGLMMARYSLVSMAKSMKLPYIVTYENDVILCENFFDRTHEFLSTLSENKINYDSIRLGWDAMPSCTDNLPLYSTAVSHQSGSQISYYDLSDKPYHLPGSFMTLLMESAYDKILSSFYNREYVLSKNLEQRKICAPGGSDNWLAHPVNGITLCPVESMATHSRNSTL